MLRPTPDPRHRGWLLCVQGIRISRPQALAHIDPIPDYIQNSSDGFVKRALTMWESATILESPFHSERSWKPSSRLPCWLACSPVACTLGDSPANGPHSSRLTCAAAGCSRRSTEPRPRPSPGLPAGPAPAGEPCGRGAPLAGPARPRRSHASTRALARVCPCRRKTRTRRPAACKSPGPTGKPPERTRLGAMLRRGARRATCPGLVAPPAIVAPRLAVRSRPPPLRAARCRSIAEAVTGRRLADLRIGLPLCRPRRRAG